ncbi:MAG: hypothetical protein KatS3mg119_1705 [Rhodothalassiaceae bacterium]|nr:MAG: hypothetical protein KatS3mg119_1705 [Rhodothalassiaceae bacterium]
MNATSTTAGAAAAPARLRVNRISGEDPWRWLAGGWQDLWRAPKPALLMGVVFWLLSLALAATLLSVDALALLLPMAGGFFLVGPFLAIGLYELGRRLERGEAVGPGVVFRPRIAAPTQVGLLAALLLFAHFVWVRIALLLFALFFGVHRELPPLETFIHDLFFTPQGLTLLAVGTAVGGVFALVTYAGTVIALPLLFDRDVDAFSAIALSVRAVRENPGPMLLWAWLIVMIAGFGIAIGFVGLIIAFPLLGLASWRAYRALVAEG